MLDDLKTLLGITNAQQDSLLTLLLSKSSTYILNRCNIDAVPTGLESAQVDIAVVIFNRLGTEGETSRSEGGLSTAFAKDMPKTITDELSMFAKIYVIGEDDA